MVTKKEMIGLDILTKLADYSICRRKNPAIKDIKGLHYLTVRKYLFMMHDYGAVIIYRHKNRYHAMITEVGVRCLQERKLDVDFYQTEHSCISAIRAERNSDALQQHENIALIAEHPR